MAGRALAADRAHTGIQETLAMAGGSNSKAEQKGEAKETKRYSKENILSHQKY